MMTIESGNSVSFSWSGSSSSLCNVVALSRIVILSKRHLLPIILIQGAIKGSGPTSGNGFSPKLAASAQVLVSFLTNLIETRCIRCFHLQWSSRLSFAPSRKASPQCFAASSGQRPNLLLSILNCISLLLHRFVHKNRPKSNGVVTKMLKTFMARVSLI